MYVPEKKIFSLILVTFVYAWESNAFENGLSLFPSFTGNVCISLSILRHIRFFLPIFPIPDTPHSGDYIMLFLLERERPAIVSIAGIFDHHAVFVYLIVESFMAFIRFQLDAMKRAYSKKPQMDPTRKYWFGKALGYSMPVNFILGFLYLCRLTEWLQVFTESVEFGYSYKPDLGSDRALEEFMESHKQLFLDAFSSPNWEKYPIHSLVLVHGQWMTHFWKW